MTQISTDHAIAVRKSSPEDEDERKQRTAEMVVLLSHKSPDSTINVEVEFGEGEDKVLLDVIAERAKKY